MRHETKVRITTVIIGLIILAVTIALSRSLILSDQLIILTIAALFIISASFISISLGISVAIIELLFGIMAGNLGLEVTESLDMLASIGSVFLLFMVGLEVDVKLVISVLKKFSIPILLTYLLGFLASLIAFALYLNCGLPCSILSAAAVSSGATSLTYMLLRNIGIHGTSKGVIIITISMVSEILSFIIATLILHKSIMMLLYPILIISAVFILPKFLHHIIEKVPSRVEHEIEVRVIIAALLILSILSEIMGKHAGLTAFIVGLVVSEVIRLREELEIKLRSITFGFLAPVFFFTAGTIFTPIISLEIAILTAIVALILWLTKVEGLKYFAKKYLTLSKHRKELATLMPNIVIATIIALIGLEEGIIDETIFSTIIQISLIITLAISVILKEMPRTI